MLLHKTQRFNSSLHLQDLGFSPGRLLGKDRPRLCPEARVEDGTVHSETQHLPEASSGLIQASTEEAACSHHPTLSSAEILWLLLTSYLI